MSPQDVSDAPTVTARVLADRIARGDHVRVVDVRDRDEFETWRIDGPNVTATQVPYARFVQAQVTGDLEGLLQGQIDGEPASDDRPSAEAPVGTGDDVATDSPLVVVCAVGEASAEVAAALDAAGIDAANLEGGMEAWGRLLTSVAVETPAGTIVQYDRPATGCLSYLLVSDHEAVVVDPLRAFTDRYARDASERGADIVYAIDTHVHADHVSGVRSVARGTDAQPVLPEGARERGLDYGVRPLASGETLSFGDAAVRAIGLPGHTSEMTGLEFDDRLLVGDSVFPDGVARPDLEAAASSTTPEATARDTTELATRLYRTLTETILSLPPDTRLYPGHHGYDAVRDADGAYSTTVAGVESVLDHLGPDRDAFVEAVRRERPRPNNFETIVAINLGLEDADDDAAFELELGPNNCAAN